MNFQRCKGLFHQHQAWVKLQLVLCLLLLRNSVGWQSSTIFTLSISTPCPPPISKFYCLFARCQLLYASSYTVLLCFSRYYRLKFFVFICFHVLFLWIVLWTYHSTYYIADCVSWIPRLTLLNLQTNWAYGRTLVMELIFP